MYVARHHGRFGDANISDTQNWGVKLEAVSDDIAIRPGRHAYADPESTPTVETYTLKKPSSNRMEVMLLRDQDEIRFPTSSIMLALKFHSNEVQVTSSMPVCH
jgi:hypothetical protein